jgi:hypothetical protein
MPPSLEANVTAAHVIEHAPRASPSFPNTAMSPETNRVWIKPRSYG